MAGGAITTLDRRQRLISRAGEAETVEDLFASVADQLRRLVPFDAAVWSATDPATGLPTTPTHFENMSHLGVEECMRAWELEFMVEDVNLYNALARADSPAGGLRHATGDRPGRSTRYRSLLQRIGFEDELRGVMREDGGPWAVIALFRHEGAPAFDQEESALLASLSEPLAAGVRDRTRPVVHSGDELDQRGPGLMLFAQSGEPISANDDALAWLEELSADSSTDAFGLPLPLVVVGTLMRARAIAEERESGSARARIRSRAGRRWLVCHASCLRNADGELGNTALVIEPAKASEVAPLLAEAYDLTPREQEITELIARGLGTADIAQRLFLSRHTVRDYVKAIFGKVHVSSRGELVAKLFAEHYAPIHYS